MRTGSVLIGERTLDTPRQANYTKDRRGTGFVNVYSEPFTVTFSFASMNEFQSYMGDVSAPIRMIMANSSPGYQAEFWQKLAGAAAPFTNANGTIRLPNECLIAADQR